MTSYGEEVVVLANNSKHGFEIGEVVIRVPSLHETENNLCFYSELNGSWNMLEIDYTPLVEDNGLTELEQAVALLKRAKKYVSRVNSIGAQGLSNEISNFLKEGIK